MRHHVDAYPQDDAKARRKQDDIRRMRYRRAIERYWEERQLHATLITTEPDTGSARPGF